MEYTIREYLQSQTCIDARIVAIENLIDAMLLSTVDSVGDSGTMSYSLDDGQMKVTTVYRSVAEVSEGIKTLETMLQRYINRKNGHITVLRGKLNG